MELPNPRRMSVIGKLGTLLVSSRTSTTSTPITLVHYLTSGKTDVSDKIRQHDMTELHVQTSHDLSLGGLGSAFPRHMRTIPTTRCQLTETVVFTKRSDRTSDLRCPSRPGTRKTSTVPSSPGSGRGSRTIELRSEV